MHARTPIQRISERQSTLYSNERRWKDDVVFEALGTADELSADVGVCRELCVVQGLFDVVETLTKVQCALQDLASHVATPVASASAAKLRILLPRSTELFVEGKMDNLERTKFDVALVEEVDGWIDEYDEGLDPLKNFILPGGGLLGAQFHKARTVCRRSERRLVELNRTGHQVTQEALRYTNRLSDLLFVLARYSAKKSGHEDVVYVRPKANVN